MKDTIRIAWGIGLLLFGVLFFLKQINVFPDYLVDIIFDLRNLPFAFGLILLFSPKNRSFGILLIVLGTLLYINNIIAWAKSISDFVWPLLLISAGALLIGSATVKKRDKPSNDSARSLEKKSAPNNES